MNVDQLEEATRRMSGGVWRCNYADERIDTVINGRPCSPYLEGDHNMEGVVALRNHAAALFRCVRTLEAIRNDNHCTTVHGMIDEAIKELNAVERTPSATYTPHV